MYSDSEQLFQTDFYQKTLIKRAKFITFIADFLAISLPVAGYFLPFKTVIDNALKLALFASSILIPACLLAVNLILTKRFAEKTDSQSFSDLQNHLLSHREHAEKTAQRKLRFLRKLRYFTSGYSVFLGLLGIICGFFGGTLGFLTSVISIPFTFFITLAALSGLRFPARESFFDNVHTSASEKDYPEIYRMAKEASDKLGCKRKIKIILTYTYNMAALKMGRFHCIVVGVPLINHLNREEFYAVLLHEFAHLSNRNAADWSEREYSLRLSQGTPHYFTSLTSSIYSYLDTRYNLEFSLYTFAAALSLENYSDRAMKLYGDPKAAASALVKGFYYDRYKWERYTREHKVLFAPEEASERDLYDRMDEFKVTIKERSEIWEKLINKEIISRTASHPTTKMRLDTLGIRDHSILPDVTDEIFAADAQKALDSMNRFISRKLKDSYEYKRKTKYLNYLRVIEKWEREGQPLDPEGYVRVIIAMCKCGKFQEADALCLRIIENIPSKESSFAHYIYGCHILRDYNDEGIDHIFISVDNHVNIEAGLKQINEYCLVTGNVKELERYQKKEREHLDRLKKLKRNTRFLKKKDKLYPEELPKDILEGILGRIEEIDTEKQISRVFVAKRIIDSEFRTMIVITFKIDVPEHDRKNIMKRMQHHIHYSYDWPFTLLRYEELGKARIEKVRGSMIYKG